MKGPRTVAVLVAFLLLAGPVLALRSDCCPSAPIPGPSVAAAGCCGGCPTSLSPSPEPASLTVKASAANPAPATAILGGGPLVLLASTARTGASPALSPPTPPPSTSAPLRL